jgi:isopenicillin N synthase-like dioxygenase
LEVVIVKKFSVAFFLTSQADASLQNLSLSASQAQLSQEA